MRSSWVFSLWAVGAFSLAATLRFGLQPYLAQRLLQLRIEALERDFAGSIPPKRKGGGRVTTLLRRLKSQPQSTASHILNGFAAPHHRPLLPGCDPELRGGLLDAVEEYLCATALLPHRRAYVRNTLGRARLPVPGPSKPTGPGEARGGSVEINLRSRTPAHAGPAQP